MPRKREQPAWMCSVRRRMKMSINLNTLTEITYRFTEIGRASSDPLSYVSQHDGAAR